MLLHPSRTTKHHYWWQFCLPVMMLIIVGCRETATSNLMQQAEALAESYPDSAYHLLKSIPKDEWQETPSDQALYALLATQTRYRLYEPIASDSLIAVAEDFYRKSNDHIHLCQSCYYRAMILYENGFQSEAIQKLKEGE